MTCFRLSIHNPFVTEKYDNLYNYTTKMTTHKYLELEVVYDSIILFEIWLNWSTRRDHAGASLTLGLLGYSIAFIIYDQRHWDHESNSWSKA